MAGAAAALARAPLSSAAAALDLPALVGAALPAAHSPVSPPATKLLWKVALLQPLGEAGGGSSPSWRALQHLARWMAVQLSGGKRVARAPPAPGSSTTSSGTAFVATGGGSSSLKLSTCVGLAAGGLGLPSREDAALAGASAVVAPVGTLSGGAAAVAQRLAALLAALPVQPRLPVLLVAGEAAAAQQWRDASQRSRAWDKRARSISSLAAVAATPSTSLRTS